MRTKTILVVAALLGAAAPAGCAHSDPSPPSTADAQKMAQYAKCMREHGVDIPAPGDGEPAGGLVTLNTADPKALAAGTACARLAPAPQKQGRPDPAAEDKALKLAECLRRHGIKAVDPRAGGTDVTLDDGATYTQQELVDAYTICLKN